MARRLESSIESAACKKIKAELGVDSLKLNLRGNRGWPDRLFFIPGGRPLLIEFKRPGTEPEPLQVYRHNQLKEWDYAIEVHDTTEGAFRAVARALEAAQVPKGRGQVVAGARVRRTVR
jgi:hypothetical protein